MADIVIKQIEEGMTGRQVADLLYSNFLALVGAIGAGGGGDIPTSDIEKGVTAYGWGDHRQAGYLKGITAGMVTGALGYTPMDEAAWTKENIKATLGIADWALAASKPTYKTSEVAEDGNLYFTNARAVAALADVTDALADDIGANATAIGVVQGYFADGVAKSAAKLATSRKLWGQSFNGTADVTGALTGVTDITASGTLTIGKIVIGDGVIEWDAANGGFKVTGGLWATDYLSSKGVNTGASGGGGGSSYQRLDTWDGYTTAKDGWVLSAKLGYGLKTTQDDILRQLADISGQGTNVTFTPSLTSGTQIGTLTIDGEPVKMYAPSIPTTDIEKGVTAHGWGNHASAGYLTQHQDLSGYQTKITDSNKLAASLVSGLSAVATSGKYGDLSGTPTSLPASDVSAWAKAASKPTYKFSEITEKPTTIGGYGITDAYTKSQVDSALGGYLQLSGGTINGGLIVSNSNGVIGIEYTQSNSKGYLIYQGGTNWRISDNGWANSYNIIHSANIGSQSVASAAKLTTARNIWGQSFDGTGDVSGVLSGVTALKTDGDYGVWKGSLFTTALTTTDLVYNATKHIFYTGNVGIGTTSPQYKLHVAESIYSSSYVYANQYLKLGDNIGIYRGNVLSSGLSTNDIAISATKLYTGANVLIGTTTDSGYKLDVSGTLHASGAATFGSSITSSGSIESTAGHMIAYGQIRLSGTGSNYSGLFLNNYITSSGSANDIWLYNPNKVIIYGSIVDVRSALNCSSTIYATTGVFSDGYVSAKGQNTTSDMRLKRVLEEVTLSVDEIAAAPAFRFSWKGGAGVDVGTSAQYWEKLVPDAVKRDDAGWRMMQYGNIAMVALISLARKVKELEEQLKIKS